ncbi:hypothetical protein DQ648_22865 [Salmonella enterica]|nr:hypothetical protein [Salmonella enterica]EBM4238899.1 hypothetical protein [Salmonella enterica]EBN2061504.1 hypothetical protein [Salmonella enterica]EBN5080205.1 hypothetical protein [Salmonella enterica]ECA0233475.1 hypothetical protein [Salmonella enterica subsp. enterica serovar Infantis]
MLSGNESSCYQAKKSATKPVTVRVSTLLNLPNLNSLTFSRGARFRWTTAERQKTQQPGRQNETRFAKQKQAGFPSRRAAP